MSQERENGGRRDQFLLLPVDRCAWPPLALSAGLLGAALALHWQSAALVVAVLMGLTILFFRDPARRIAADSRAFVSPADGIVTQVGQNPDPDAGPVGGPSITIFLAVWNVHVNRVPHHGQVEKVVYQPGGHAMAFRQSAEGNESNWIWFRWGERRFVVRQVAGSLARRVVCRLRAGDWVRQGQRLGIIKLGSRTDLNLPPGCQVLVRPGDRVRGGVSVIALAPED